MVFWDCTLSDCYTHTRVCVCVCECVCTTIHNSQSRKKVEAEFYGSAEALFLFCIKKIDIIAFGVQMAILSRMYPCKECADHFKEVLRYNIPTPSPHPTSQTPTQPPYLHKHPPNWLQCPTALWLKVLV